MKLSIITATYNRPQMLQSNALPSVLAQTIAPEHIEWIVINDGNNPKTAQIVESLHAQFKVIHCPIPHPQKGFGLCHARNQGLAIASGKLIAYLDDDNALHPDFSSLTLKFFEQPTLKFAMVRQRRRRDSSSHQGIPFIAPSQVCTIDDLIRHDQLFDSNGFAHRRHNAPQWNPNYRIFCDYHYFLQCITHWTPETFRLNPSILVEYVQSPNGIIGQSLYGEWANELFAICHDQTLAGAIAHHKPHLLAIAQQWQRKGERSIPAFA